MATHSLRWPVCQHERRRTISAEATGSVKSLQHGFPVLILVLVSSALAMALLWSVWSGSRAVTLQQLPLSCDSSFNAVCFAYPYAYCPCSLVSGGSTGLCWCLLHRRIKRLMLTLDPGI